MINLLPDETKKQLHAAHTNVTLIKYLFLLGCASVFLILACGVAYMIAMNSESTKANSSSTQGEIVAYDSNKAQLDNFKLSFSNAKKILDKQIPYSKIITELGAILPSGTVLESLALTNDGINSPTSLQVKAQSTNDAQKIKDNLKSSALLKNSNVQSIETIAGDSSGYPVSVVINLSINKGALQ
ncbi:MAG: hypothetical protein PWQ10_8 [Patescibacteria group bacterium]|nr:hypothetical protein [Patescibacteria group bacterium]